MLRGVEPQKCGTSEVWNRQSPKIAQLHRSILTHRQDK